MKYAHEIAAELATIESRSKGELMKKAAAVIMGQAHIIAEQKKAYDKLTAELERCRVAMPVGHPRTDYGRLSRASEILDSYCATHTCDACPLSPACRGIGMELPRMIGCVAETVEKPMTVEQFASTR